MNNKVRYHKEWKTKFHKVASYLMGPGASFNITSNKGGRGVLGEITLHSDLIYIQAGGSCDPDEVPDKLLENAVAFDYFSIRPVVPEKVRGIMIRQIEFRRSGFQ